MNETVNYQAPLIANGPTWLTLSFVLIGVGILFALFVLFWGSRLARRRHKTRAELEERGEVVEVPARQAPPVAPSPPPIADAEAPASAPEPIVDAPVAAAAPASDELTRLKGVGPRLAEQLNAQGITSFAQIAALSQEEAEALDAKMGSFQGRIHRDRWIEQARFLAAGDTAGYEAVFGKL